MNDNYNGPDIHISISADLKTNENPQGYIVAISSYGQGGGNDLADGPFASGTVFELIDDLIAVLKGYRNSNRGEISDDLVIETPFSPEWHCLNCEDKFR